MRKRILISVVLVLFLLIVVGCSNNVKNTLPGVENQSMVVLSMYVPQDEQAISGTVTLTREGMEVNAPLSITGATATATVSNLEEGTWHIVARLRDNQNFIIYEGERDAIVQSGGAVTVNLHLNMNPGDVTTIVNLANIPGAVGGKIQFKNGDTLMTEGALNISGTQGTTVFTNLKARVWDIVASVTDSTGKNIRSARSSVQILPGRMNYVTIDFETGTGDLVINVTWDLPPAFPANVTAQLINGQVIVNWTANTETKVVGYRVYRALAQTGPFIRVSGTLVTGTEFIDTQVFQGKTYWYQVIAVADDGSDSGFPETQISVSYPVPETVNRSVFVDYNASSGLLPSNYNIKWANYGISPSGISLVDGELRVQALTELIGYTSTHQWVNTDKLYMKVRAKRLGGIDGFWGNSVAWVCNGSNGVALQLYSTGLVVNNSVILPGFDVSVFHEYEVRLLNNNAEIYVDGELRWNGQVGARAEKWFMFGDGSVRNSYFAITSIEAGKIIE